MTLTIEIPRSVELDLKDAARRKGMSLEAYVLSRLTESEAESTSEDQTDTWDSLQNLVAEFQASMPSEEWNRLPADYATNFKDYLQANRQNSK